MGLFSQWKLSDVIEIKASPEKIWEFFVNLEENYTDWHPADHVKFRWFGEPMKTGTKWYAEEMVHGHLFKLRGKVGKVVPFKKVVLKYTFPIAIVSPKFEWIIKSKGTVTEFHALSYLNAGDFFRMLSKKEMDWKLEATIKHTKEEGEYLKRVLEGKGVRYYDKSR